MASSMTEYALDYNWQARGDLPEDFVFDILRDGQKVGEFCFSHSGEDQRVRRPGGGWQPVNMICSIGPAPFEIWPGMIPAIEAKLALDVES